MNAETAVPGGKKILVVDDDQIILKTLSIVLISNGYQVFTASDGPGAATIVAQERPDLILLDLLFPPDAANVGGALQDGFFIIEWLRSNLINLVAANVSSRHIHSSLLDLRRLTSAATHFLKTL
jgi:CheY-like chemotaxis protein